MSREILKLHFVRVTFQRSFSDFSTVFRQLTYQLWIFRPRPFYQRNVFGALSKMALIKYGVQETWGEMVVG